MSTYRKTVMDNGITVISEEIDRVRSLSLGVWVNCGSRNEEHSTNGAAHFIEHMLFKGTKKRTAFDIASEIDSVGGILNACTGKELTSFYVKIPDYHLSLAIDLLADILKDSAFDPEEMEKEKSVILQEIRMVEDTPDDFIHDFFGKAFWGGHPLSLPVLGTEDSVRGIRRDALLEIFEKYYRGGRLVLTAAGCLRHDELVSLVGEALGSVAPAEGGNGQDAPTPTARVAVLEKDLEQVHMVIGSPGHTFSDPARYAGFIVNTVLGGSMSSRLFQEVREKRGLAYAIHSYLVSYRDAGMFGVYAGAGDEKVGEVLDVIFAELRKLKTDLLPDKELSSAKEQIKGRFLLSMESTDTRMTRLAKNEIYLGRDLSVDEAISNLESVSAEEVREVARSLFKKDTVSVAAIGRVTEDDIAGNMPDL